MTTISSIRQILEQRKGQKIQIEKNIAAINRSVKDHKRSLHRHEQAREVIRAVGLATQQQLQYHISEISSLALEAVFDDPYSLGVEFIQRRNKTECDLYFTRGKDVDNKIDPISASGGGAVDVASFALRTASWAMQVPRSRPVLMLDEPFRYLSTGLLPRAGEMLKQISSELDLQIIMVTHAEELIDEADAVFSVDMNKGESIVRKVEAAV